MQSSGVIGSAIGSYVVRAKIGVGGMGSVYVAEHGVLGRRAAIKVLLPEMSRDQNVVTRFFNEARAASAIKHPSIVEIYDFGYTSTGEAFIVMEYLAGESLAQRCHAIGRLDLRRAMMFARQVAGGLAAAHDHGIVHRDLKPDNIYLVPDPEVVGGERIKLLDFGIAKLDNGLANTSLTQTGAVFGTPAYMSPEQCRSSGTVDARADVYSLGCVLYEMLLGRPPFVADGVGDVMAHHLYFEPVPPREIEPSLPEAVERIVMWLLRKDPAQRPQTAREVIQAIERIGSGTGELPMSATPRPAITKPTTATAPTTLSGASGVSTTPPLVSTSSRWRWIVPAVAIATAVASVAIYSTTIRADEPTASPAPIATPMKPIAPTTTTPPAPAPVVPAPAPVPARPIDVAIAIESEPAGATVMLGGTPVGTTPFIDHAQPGDERVYTIKKDGFEVASTTVPTDRDQTRKVVLKKRRSVTRPTTTTTIPTPGNSGVNPFDK